MNTHAARRIGKKNNAHARSSHLLAAAALLTVMSGAQAVAQSYKFKTIDIPGADQTALLGNAGGTILGWNYDPVGNPTCTLIQKKTYTAISDTNGVQTNCYAISNAETVVGYYNRSDDSAIGFTYNNGAFSDFSLPGISGALPIATSGNGIIAGYYYDQDNQPWGFALRRGKVTSFQISGAAYIFPTGINNHGEMILSELDMSGNSRCMMGSAPNFTELTAPGAVLTSCNGINNNGQISGSYEDNTGVFHGFVYDPVTSRYYTIDYPGAADTYLRGITNSKVLIGYYRATDGGPRHGMKATGTFPVSRR